MAKYRLQRAVVDAPPVSPAVLRAWLDVLAVLPGARVASMRALS